LRLRRVNRRAAGASPHRLPAGRRALAFRAIGAAPNPPGPQAHVAQVQYQYPSNERLAQTGLGLERLPGGRAAAHRRDRAKIRGCQRPLASGQFFPREALLLWLAARRPSFLLNLAVS